MALRTKDIDTFLRYEEELKKPDTFPEESVFCEHCKRHVFPIVSVQYGNICPLCNAQM